MTALAKQTSIEVAYSIYHNCPECMHTGRRVSDINNGPRTCPGKQIAQDRHSSSWIAKYSKENTHITTIQIIKTHYYQVSTWVYSCCMICKDALYMTLISLRRQTIMSLICNWPRNQKKTQNWRLRNLSMFGKEL